jgi:hypothetical protein
MKSEKFIKLKLLERIQIVNGGENYNPGDVIDYPLSDWEKIPQQFRNFAIPVKE